MLVRNASSVVMRASGKLSGRALRKSIRKGMQDIFDDDIFIVGGDNPEASRHIRDAQMGLGRTMEPSPIELTYGGKAVGKNRLLSGVRECRTTLREAFIEKHKDFADCDEYPFFSTTNGGPGRDVSYRLIPWLQNRKVGAILGVFYRLTKMTPMKDEFVVIADADIEFTLGVPGIKSKKRR